MDKSRRGFRLPQHSHLRTLKNFVSEKSGKREKSGEYWIKSGNFEEVHVFPVSAPEKRSFCVQLHFELKKEK